MSASNTTENAILAALFNGTTWAGYLQNVTTSAESAIALALHTADPGEAGNASTSEAAYTSYSRPSVNRNSGGWTVAGSTVNPTAIVEFPAATGGNENESFWSTVKATGGSSALILVSGGISPAVNVTNGVTPRLTTATTITFD